MNRDARTFLALPQRDRRDVFEAAASRLDTLPSYVEKDFWVSLVLNLLYKRAPERASRTAFERWNLLVENLWTHRTVFGRYRSRDLSR